MLLVAVAVHGGIALFLGMATFGLMMIFANGIFLAPSLFQSREQRLLDRESRDAWDDESDLDDEFLDVDFISEVQDEERERLNRKRDKIAGAASRVKRRYRALKQREEKYQKRVKKLREREAKIKQLVEKQREKQRGDDSDADE